MERLCFGVSCAFVALRLLTETSVEVDGKRLELRDKMMLLGLLVWRITDEEKYELFQKLEEAEKEIKTLKRMRHEGAKANEKVVGIFASREQNWLNEKKRLNMQIGALMKEMRIMEKTKRESLSELEEKLKEMEALVQSKDKALGERENKEKDLEEKLAKAEKEAQELRETREKEVQEHSGKLWKQKKALLELVSTQRQLEAELGRAVKLNEAKRNELDLVLEQREESALLAQKLSSEIMKMRKQIEKKDHILSMMPRRTKINTAEKQKLSKEVKVAKAELETENWRNISESRKHERKSLRSMFAVDEAKSRGASNPSKPRSKIVGPIICYEHHELNQDPNIVQEIAGLYSTGDFGEQVSPARTPCTTKKGSEGKRLMRKNSFADGQNLSVDESEILEKSSNTSQQMITIKDSPCRMDLHALGVSYKTKRLKQQLDMLERFTGKQESKEIDEGKKTGKRALVPIISLLNKQVSRYQSLQEKTDDLCKRMHENDLDKSCGDSKTNGDDAKTTLEHFLEETFQLQRYIVATGQKLIEVQSKIASGFVGFIEDFNSKSSSSSSSSNSSLDTKRFAESIRTLFLEVQRGLEVRIARIIGDLEGTLAREGIIHLKRRGH